MVSGRKAAQAPESWLMSSRARSGSVPRPCMTWTNPAVSGSPTVSGMTSVLSLKVGSAVNSLAVSDHQRSCSGRLLLARAASSDSKRARAMKRPSSGTPAGGGLGPAVEGGVELLRVRHLSLNDLNEHLGPPLGVDELPWRRPYRECRTWVRGGGSGVVGSRRQRGREQGRWTWPSVVVSLGSDRGGCRPRAGG